MRRKTEIPRSDAIPSAAGEDDTDVLCGMAQITTRPNWGPASASSFAGVYLFTVKPGMAKVKEQRCEMVL